MENVIQYDLRTLAEAARKVVQSAGDRAVWLLEGQMGAGKTTLAKAICAQLGVEEPVSSPTFAIVNEYRDRDGKPVYHCDFYRLEEPEEALDIGIEEYFASGAVCLLEWASRIEGLLPEERFVIRIETDPAAPDRRTLHLSAL